MWVPIHPFQTYSTFQAIYMGWFCPRIDFVEIWGWKSSKSNISLLASPKELKIDIQTDRHTSGRRDCISSRVSSRSSELKKTERNKHVVSNPSSHTEKNINNWRKKIIETLKSGITFKKLVTRPP